MLERYDGCLTHVKPNITDALPPGQTWVSENGIKALIGNPTVVNEHNFPWTTPPAWYDVFFGNYFIQPTAYSLMGRRIPTLDHSYLRDGDFFGHSISGNLVLLSSYRNSPFSFGVIRTFSVLSHESFKGFRLEIKEPNTNSNWRLGIGQIEVFGYIFSQYHSIKRRNNVTCGPRWNKRSLHAIILSNLIWLSKTSDTAFNVFSFSHDESFIGIRHYHDFWSPQIICCINNIVWAKFFEPVLIGFSSIFFDQFLISNPINFWSAKDIPPRHMILFLSDFIYIRVITWAVFQAKFSKFVSIPFQIQSNWSGTYREVSS